MLTDERHSYILQALSESEIIKTNELMNQLNCSESTIRRDLAALEEEGLLVRVHGGAKKTYQLDQELTYEEKSIKNVQNKTEIGKAAASLVSDNDIIYIDAGTTTLAMIEYLKAKELTVVTNGVLHASMLVDRNIHTILIGGTVKNSTKAIIGSASVAALKNYQFMKAFLGINGISARYGFTTPDPEEAVLKQLAIQQAQSSYVLADESKFDKITFSKVADLEDATIITDAPTNAHKYFQDKTEILEVKA